MHATDLVGINNITRVLLVYTCQQGVYPRGLLLPLRLPLDVHSANERCQAGGGYVKGTVNSRNVCIHCAAGTDGLPVRAVILHMANFVVC
jgi:hypothetical protein